MTDQKLVGIHLEGDIPGALLDLRNNLGLTTATGGGVNHSVHHSS